MSPVTTPRISLPLMRVVNTVQPAQAAVTVSIIVGSVAVMLNESAPRSSTGLTSCTVRSPAWGPESQPAANATASGISKARSFLIGPPP